MRKGKLGSITNKQIRFFLMLERKMAIATVFEGPTA